MDIEQGKKKPYEKLQKIGEGAYGCVYKAKDPYNGQLVALKIIKIDRAEEGVPSTTLRQISICKQLSHPNIIQLKGVDYDMSGTQPKIEMVFQYMDEDLSKYIRRQKNIEISLVKKYFYQILKGVNYMHSQRIFHRDLKPQNILINKKGIIKIADFGLGRVFSRPMKTMSKEIQTLWYRAPQLLFGCQKYDLSVDVWSLGCILYELAEKGKILFHSDCEVELIIKIFQLHGTPHINEWPQLLTYPHFKPTFPKFTKRKLPNFQKLSTQGIDLLLKMIEINPNRRITVPQALEHAFFDDLDIKK